MGMPILENLDFFSFLEYEEGGHPKKQLMDFSLTIGIQSCYVSKYHQEL